MEFMPRSIFPINSIIRHSVIYMSKNNEIEKAKLIVEIISNNYNNGATDEIVIAELEKMGVCAEHAQDAIELFNIAIGRAQLLNIGMKPSQFNSTFEDNEIFKASLEKLLGYRIEAQDKINNSNNTEASSSKKAWWKFW